MMFCHTLPTTNINVSIYEERYLLAKSLRENLFIGYVFVEFFLYDFAQILCINLLPSFALQLQSINTIHRTHPLHLKNLYFNTKKNWFQTLVVEL